MKKEIAELHGHHVSYESLVQIVDMSEANLTGLYHLSCDMIQRMLILEIFRLRGWEITE